jgi:hypothetical protein
VNPFGRRMAAAMLVVILLSSPAQAVIPDPVEAGLLAKIAAALEAIEQFRLRVLDKLHIETYNRIRGYAFPATLFGQLQASATAVIDIRRQIDRLGCSWPTTARTQGLREALLRRTTLCRAGHNDIWGSHERFWDAPIQEMNDYVGVMTANMISERVERTNSSWAQAHRDLFFEHAIFRDSPGDANRAEAAALAWANQVAVGNSQIATQNLLVRQMARDLDRFDQKKAVDLTYYTYRGLATLAGGDWRGVPPDPSEQVPR